MNYPKYDNNELHSAMQNGSFEISEFSNFIDELLENGYIEHPAEIGVAKFISSNGTKLLTSKQKQVLELILSRHSQTECNRCGSIIELSELINSYTNKGYCGYCQYQLEKND